MGDDRLKPVPPRPHARDGSGPAPPRHARMQPRGRAFFCEIVTRFRGSDAARFVSREAGGAADVSWGRSYGSYNCLRTNAVQDEQREQMGTGTSDSRHAVGGFRGGFHCSSVGSGVFPRQIRRQPSWGRSIIGRWTGLSYSGCHRSGRSRQNRLGTLGKANRSRRFPVIPFARVRGPGGPFHGSVHVGLVPEEPITGGGHGFLDRTIQGILDRRSVSRIWCYSGR